MLVLERADCAYGYRRNRPATNTGMEKNANINTGTHSKTGSARTSTGILLIRVLTYVRYSIFWVEIQHGGKKSHVQMLAWMDLLRLAGGKKIQ